MSATVVTLVRGGAATVLLVGVLVGCAGSEGTQGTGGDVTALASPPTTAQATTQPRESESEVGAAGGLRGVIEQLLRDAPIEFEPQTADLTEGSVRTIGKLADATAAQRQARLVITVTVVLDDVDEAQALAQQRLAAVVSELVDAGVDDERIDGEALGSGSATDEDAEDDAGDGGVDDAGSVDIAVVDE